MPYKNAVFFSPEDFPPARLFRPACLMFFKKIFPPACLFRPARLFGTLEYNFDQKIIKEAVKHFQSFFTSQIK